MKFADNVFRTFDADGDNKLDFREFMTAINLSQKAGPSEQLKWAFEMYDIDGSGEITMFECTRMIKVCLLFYLYYLQVGCFSCMKYFTD